MKITLLRDDEKTDLRAEILRSAKKVELRQQRAKYSLGIAATITILVGLTIYVYEPPVPTSILDFVESSRTQNMRQSDQVTLILSGDQNLNIDDDVANINYSNSGQNITVGTAKTIDQAVSESGDVIYNTLLVPYGKRSKVQLSDGSTVWLNSGSRMVYPAVFNNQKREVYLEGEAIFDVAHIEDHPFMVVCKDQEVEVLGTEFGVTNYLDENTIKTVLKSGSVQINYREHRMRISPGTIVSYNKETRSINSDKINVDHYFSWREGVLIFKNNDLQFILKRLARYYNVDISLQHGVPIDETFSGYLDLNDNLDIVMGNLKESADINFVLSEDELIVKP